MFRACKARHRGRALLALACAAMACSGDDETSTAGLKIVQDPAGGIYAGVYNWFEGGADQFEAVLGQPAPLIGNFCPGDGGIENTPLAIDIACREARYNKGQISVYGLEPPGCKVPSPAYTVQGTIDGQIDADLRAVARRIAQWGRPLFWLYQREPPGQWPGYGADGQGCWSECVTAGVAPRDSPACLSQYGDPTRLDGPERYVDFHRHVHDVVEDEIRQLGLPSNITWVMGAIIENDNRLGTYRDYYPGNDYVDWHAFDFYAGATDEPGQGPTSDCPLFPGLLKPYWNEALALDAGKPVMLVELGVAAANPQPPNPCGDRTAWFRDFFDTTAASYENLAAFIYWQTEAGTIAGNLQPHGISPTEPAAATWQTEIQSRPTRWPTCVSLANGDRVCR